MVALYLVREFAMNLPLHIGDEEFKIACYSIPLAGFDLVLGVQWL